MEGPQFSTKAESNLYRSWGCDVVGMTNMPEAKLAREAELPYASVGMVTDYDCWREGEDNVDVAAVIKILNENAFTASKYCERIFKNNKGLWFRDDGSQGIERNLDFAIITPQESRDSLLVAKLDAIAGRVLN